MAKSKIDIIYDMVNLAYDVKRQWSKDKDSIWLGEYARAVIKAKDEKVYDKFVDLANLLETEGWDEFVDACKYLIDEYNQIEESKKSMKESEENFVYYIAVYDEDGNCRGYLQNESWRITQDIDKAMHFKRDMDAREVILKATKRAFNDDELYIEGMYLNESKKSARKSIKESRIDKGTVVYAFSCMLNELGFKAIDYSNEENNEKCDDIVYMIMDLLKTMPRL